MNPKKHITVQRMATPKHTEPPSLVSTHRKNTTTGERLHYHMTTVIDKIWGGGRIATKEAQLCGVMVGNGDYIHKKTHTKNTLRKRWKNRL